MYERYDLVLSGVDSDRLIIKSNFYASPISTAGYQSDGVCEPFVVVINVPGSAFLFLRSLPGSLNNFFLGWVHSVDFSVVTRSAHDWKARFSFFISLRN